MRSVALVTAVLMLSAPAFAQTGPVATACKADIQKYCANKGHGNRQIRSCLEANHEKLSAACQTTLSSTRGGRR